jgi:hypothetical protein
MLKYTLSPFPFFINFQSKMKQDRCIKLFNPKIKTGLVSWRKAGLFTGEYPEKLFTEVHKRQIGFQATGQLCADRLPATKEGAF